jgi:hypothetical protein
MNPGECVLEAHPGSVDLGVRAQLEEIERGFFDLLEQREKQGSGLSEPTSQKRDVGHPRPHRIQISEEQSGVGQ